LPKVQKLTETRKKSIKARLKEHSDDQFWEDLFTRVEAADTLTGRKQGFDWKASFDWIIKPANLTKIKEGNYDNKGKTAKHPNYGPTGLLEEI
jgi:hypothetical protein